MTTIEIFETNRKQKRRRVNRMVHNSADPTNETYGAFYRAYEFFNAALFNKELPGALFSLQRRHNTRGYFSFSRFGHRRDDDQVVDEIALSPATFVERTDREIVSTVVHEMRHQHQFHFGNPSRRGYHNREWAAAMIDIGLIPSHTGEPGGKQTGQKVSHYILEGGPFDLAWRRLEKSGFKLDYQDLIAARPDKPRKDGKPCYRCGCDDSPHLFGKPGIGDRYRCDVCHGYLTERQPTEASDGRS